MWTASRGRLLLLLTTHPPPPSSSHSADTPLPPIRLEGPHGRLALTPDDYPRLLLLGGGVGITPLTSTLRWLQQQVGD